MWSMNGQWYTSTMWPSGNNLANIAAAAYGSRTCVGLSGATSAWGRVQFAGDIYPSFTASDASRKMAGITRLRFAAETLAVVEGESQLIARFILADSIVSSNSRIDACVYVYNDGGTFKIKVYFDDIAGTPAWSGDVGTIAAGTTFYKLEMYHYLDKTSIYWEDAFVEDITYSAAKSDQRINQALFYWEDTLAVWHLDDFYSGHEEVDFGTAAGRSTTNGSPDDGTLYLIKAGVISAAIAAGDAEELAIADGEFTPTLTDEDDYLAAKVLDGNDAGFAVKIAYSGSAGWVKSDWSL